jgi:hypothetical protein
MAIIVIKDLPDSFELDRQAMLAISGGARSRGQAPVTRRGGFYSRPMTIQGPAAHDTRTAPKADRLKIYSARRTVGA